MPQEPDPFSKLHDAIASIVSNSQAFRALVKEVNFIDFDEEKKQPIRSNVQGGNLPEVMLTCTGNIEGNLSNSTTSTKLVRQWQFLVSTGDLRIKRLLNPVEFAITAAMSNWPEFVKLKWKDKSFVKAVRFVNSVTGISDAKLNRGIEGWSAVITLNFDLYFRTTDLQGIN